ncbi:hypothetical protein I7I50_09537 [Histoplasma capsulatum G186AR]|uniref:Uncharacterized protein n=1 Tax=Ajellomyces capsulatus TaxID=5037 RepID=A0A8H7YVM1_AJECA|nr:hypothetical protein I7I52_07058 [Histoplasma capsulatum]QSS74396.1 hypothetical protein I7I50_09537 [Histoplasma capsulatum G186AR]
MGSNFRFQPEISYLLYWLAEWSVERTKTESWIGMICSLYRTLFSHSYYDAVTSFRIWKFQ